MKTTFHFLVVALTLLTSYATDLTPEPTAELPIGRLAFVRGESFASDGTIIVVGEQIEPFQGSNPEFAKKSNRLIYSSDTVNGRGIFVRNLATNVSSKIENNANYADSPSLSPDESKVAFTVQNFATQDAVQIFVSDVDGSNWIPLTSGKYFNWSPRWSPDGNKILFETTRDGKRQIYTMDSDGKNQVNITNSKKMSHSPAWSPDGTRIAYMSSGESNKANIFVMKSDGSQKINLSKGITRDSEPVWSPDGEWIAFTRTVEKNGPGLTTMNIWIMKSDGSDQKPITQNKQGISSYQLSWSTK